jgi:cell fate regulator YaaT (PSP1 superfamily)
MVEANISLDQLEPQHPEEKSHSGCGSCGTGTAAARCGNGLERIYPTTAVRFGYMRYVGEFTHAPDMKFTCGAKVIVQTRRGLEMGEQVSLTCGGCDKSVTRDAMKKWVESCGEDSYMFDAGRILREATAADLAEYSHIQASGREKRRFCQELARQQKIPIKIVECESPFGGERIVFYFLAEERVDFRGLVRDLTKEYRTRIEMRQVGARDEARLLADYETCGREVCCKVFLKTLRPISMRMAKLQKATLDPSQVSGRCGRLKCCLRYEHIGYEELDKKLPRTGIRIHTSHGDGVVINRQVLTQLVQIRTDEDKLVTVVAEDILEVGVAAPPRPVPRLDGPVEGPGFRRRPPRPAPGPRVPLRSLAEPVAEGSDDMDGADEIEESEPIPPPAPTSGTTPPSAAAVDGQPPRRRRGRRRRGRRPGGPPFPGGPAGQAPPSPPSGG